MSQENNILNILRTKWSDLKLLSKAGGNSIVYKSESEQIAIKVFSSTKNNRYKRFKEEVTSIEKLSGVSNIVPIILEPNLPKTLKKFDDMTSISDVPYFVMPLYKGSLTKIIKGKDRSFNKKLQDDGTFAVSIILSVAKTLFQLHSKELAHRDIKPDNILYDENYNVFVSDFGLCLDLNTIDTRITGPAEIVGALNYRAPEFMRGKLGKGDHRAGDIFSLGRTLWALLNIKEPFNLTDLEFDKKHVSDIGRVIRKANPLDDIIKGMTMFDPTRRMKIEEVTVNLENWLEDHKSGSTESIIEIMKSNQKTQDRLKEKRIADFIQEEHKRTKEFIEQELDQLINEWRKIILGISMGSQPQVTAATGYSSDFLPEVLNMPQINDQGIDGLRIRFGSRNDLTLDPLLELSLLIRCDLNKVENQEYQIVAAYIPKNNTDRKPVLVHGGDIRNFSYESGNIRQEILKELETGFYKLDKVLKDNIK